MVGLCLHCNSLSGQHPVGTGFRPQVHGIYITADFNGEILSRIQIVPVRIGHGHSTLALIPGAQDPSFVIARYADDAAVGHGDACDRQVKIFALLKIFVYQVAVILVADPLLPPGQHVAVAEIEVFFHDVLFDVKLALIVNRNAIYNSLDPDSDPADPIHPEHTFFDIDRGAVRRIRKSLLYVHVFGTVMVYSKY